MSDNCAAMVDASLLLRPIYCERLSGHSGNHAVYDDNDVDITWPAT